MSDPIGGGRRPFEPRAAERCARIETGSSPAPEGPLRWQHRRHAHNHVHAGLRRVQQQRAPSAVDYRARSRQRLGVREATVSPVRTQRPRATPSASVAPRTQIVGTIERRSKYDHRRILVHAPCHFRFQPTTTSLTHKPCHEAPAHRSPHRPCHEHRKPQGIRCKDAGVRSVGTRHCRTPRVGGHRPTVRPLLPGLVLHLPRHTGSQV